jgi:hypothetical protein
LLACLLVAGVWIDRLRRELAWPDIFRTVTATSYWVGSPATAAYASSEPLMEFPAAACLLACLHGLTRDSGPQRPQQPLPIREWSAEPRHCNRNWKPRKGTANTEEGRPVQAKTHKWTPNPSKSHRRQYSRIGILLTDSEEGLNSTRRHESQISSEWVPKPCTTDRYPRQ